LEPAVQSRATENPDATANKDRRLRAVYRRELQTSVRFSALVVAAGIALATAASSVVSPSKTTLLIALDAPLVVAAITCALAVKRKYRRHVILLGMLTGVLPVISTALSGAVVEQNHTIAMSAIGVIPIAFAVFIPLQRGPHIAWLAVANILLLAIGLPIESATGHEDHLIGLLAAAGMATLLSIGANEIQLRRRHEMDRQLVAVRGLYGRMKEHELDLRRQDEFLFMQQETLVVQQAELLRLNEELETIARLDALTGLGNRLRLNEDLAQVAGRIERSGGSVGLLLMDLDRFKRLNDVSGHLAGDAALRGVAEVLRKTSRVGDGLYRYGGEEFLVILHDCDESVLASAGQRYLTAIEAAGMPHPDNPPYGVVTASAGATELCQINCLDVDSALHDADEALYIAKANGRNRLELQFRVASADVVPIKNQRAAS
jgi:diguanylate cyclase (GGDEF)-like protein